MPVFSIFQILKKVEDNKYYFQLTMYEIYMYKHLTWSPVALNNQLLLRKYCIFTEEILYKLSTRYAIYLYKRAQRNKKIHGLEPGLPVFLNDKNNDSYSNNNW